MSAARARAANARTTRAARGRVAGARAGARGERAGARRRIARPAGATAATTAFDMRTYVERDLTAEERVEVMRRPRVDFTSILDTVKPIVEAVGTRGDAAVREYTSKFDGVDLEAVTVRVDELPDPVLDDDVKKAFDVAYDNIAAFHAAQAKSGDVDVTTMPGVRCRRVSRPIGAVGLYVPGGTAVLPSTALMLLSLIHI